MADRSQFDVVFSPVEAGDLDTGPLLCIQVPLGMLKILVGALEPFIYPDAYYGTDAERVKSARQVETFLATMGIVPCPTDTQVAIPCPTCGGGVVILEEDMGQVVTRVYVDDGVLYVEYGPCCIQTFDFTTDLGFKLPGETEWKTVYLPPESAGFTYTGCAKALALADVFFGVVDQLTDDAADGQPPWAALSRMANRFPTINFGTADLLAAYAGALGVAIGGLITEVEDFEFRQALTCAYASILADDDVGVTASEWSSLKGIHNGVVNRTFSILTFPIGWVDMQRLLVFAFAAIGAGDAREITTSVQAGEDDDCSCPEASGLPGDLFTVEYTFDFDFFNPNTSDLRDMTITGNNPGYNFKAIAVEWNGQNGGNGEIKLDDAGARYLISRYSSPFEGVFVLHDNSAAAIGWAGLYFPTATKFVCNTLSMCNDGTVTIQTLGNNVDVHTDGTITALYDPADEP
jgi:hypothetical protein